MSAPARKGPEPTDAVSRRSARAALSASFGGSAGAVIEGVDDSTGGSEAGGCSELGGAADSLVGVGGGSVSWAGAGVAARPLMMRNAVVAAKSLATRRGAGVIK
jgi:hypothetical protein